MRTTFACGHCGTPNRFTTYSVAYWREKQQAAMQRCDRCGASHGCRNYQAEVISPPIRPIDKAGRVSSYYRPEHRPLEVGLYDVQFRETHAFGMYLLLRLWWNGVFFQISEHDKRRVDTRTMRCWRGVWA